MYDIDKMLGNVESCIKSSTDEEFFSKLRGTGFEYGDFELDKVFIDSSSVTSIRFEMNEVYISKCVHNLWEEYKVLDRTPCYVTTDHGRFRINEFTLDGGDTVEYFVDTKGSHETLIFASDSYDNVGMDRIKKAREKLGATNDRRSQVQA